ncbi:MAG: hypothetical protein HFF52_08580 [Lawsonibacter sp.]|nr:hypothetical protein [Lawsonibacter sp.]
MNKKIIPWALLCALLLGGCQWGEEATAASSPPPESVPKTAQELLEEQTIDDTHDAFLVDTGGRLGALLVTVERGEENSEGELGGYFVTISVWDPQNMEKPIQTMESELEYAAFKHHDVVDANFDGYQDFGYMWFIGNQPTYWDYWIWNEETGQFVSEPEFRSISSPVFDAETKEIHGWARESGAADGVNTIHKWVDGELVCVRRIEVRKTDSSDGPFDLAFVLIVQDRIDGELTEVFRTEFPAGSGGYFEERSKWEDLDYHGETR